MKNFFLMTFLTFFLIAFLASGAAVQTLPWRDQLSFFANQSLFYIQQTTQPFFDWLHDVAN
ncbi:MAG: hypothetical protein U1E36_07310 [Rickettsiales bacterium]